MYRNVIVGVDGLQGGADAAALAAVLAAPGAQITLVYVSTVPFASRASTRELDLADDRALAALLTTERDLGGPTARVIRTSATTVGAGLEQAAAEQRAELTVVGASRHHGLSRLLGGDDARSAAQHAAGAVALAPPHYGLHPAPVLRVGVAADDTPEGEVAVAHAGLIAAGRGGELRVLPATPGRGLVDRVTDFARDVDVLVCGSAHQRALRRWAEGDLGGLPRRVGVPLVFAPAADPSALARWRATGQPARA